MAQKAFEIAFDGQAVEAGFYGDLTALTIEEGTASPARLLIQLGTDHLDNGTWRYLDDARLEPFTRVSASIGFVNQGGASLQRLFDGYVTSIDVNLGSQPGDTHIELSGLDASVLMSLEEKIATWANQSDADIVKAIVAGYGVTIKADTTQTVHNADNTTIVQRGTDIQFVQALAQRNGFEFFLEPDAGGGSVTAYFRTPVLSGAPQSDLAVQFGGSSNLRSFVARLAGQRPLNVKATQMDIQSNSPVSASASQTQLTTLGQRDLNSLVGGPLGSLVTPSDAQAAMLILGSPTSDQTELQVLTQAVRDEAGWFIEASGEINSDAYGAVLRPRRLVLVKGAGTQYSGTYYVTRVVHEVRADGSYSQKFQARRNARDLSGAEQFGSSS